MAEHQISYEGPSELAIEVATMLADADGVDLTSSEPPDRQEASDGVVLRLVVDGSTEAVSAAVDRIRALLPSGTTIDVTGR